MKPDGRCDYGVLLVGEALGEAEAVGGLPFIGRAGFLLNKLIKHAGLTRDGFTIGNAVWCRPPDNKLSGMPYESVAVSECHRRHLAPLIDRLRPRVVVPMGAVALSSLLGGRKDIINARGYVWQSRYGIIYPTVHPSFIMRGNGEYGTVFIHDLQRAVELARDGWHPAVTHYTLDPPPDRAVQWAEEYLVALASNPSIMCAFDIETPYDDEDKEEGELDNYVRTILRISFAYRPHHALSIPWRGEYMPAIVKILGSLGAKVVWNEGFDVPIVRGASVDIAGPIYDGMVAWHVLQSDLRKKLGFVATMVLDDQPPWKYLNASMPAFYNAADADVELRCVLEIFTRLRAAGLWDVYDRHILQLAPLLARLSSRGMPVDTARREMFAGQLAERQAFLLTQMTAAVPLTARKIAHVYKPDAKITFKGGEEYLERPCVYEVSVCTGCGQAKPNRAHFRALKKPTPKRPQNLCAGACVRLSNVEGTEWYRLAPFRPSKEQLLTYCQVTGEKPPTRRSEDGIKISFDSDGCERMRIKYPSDTLWETILDYREIDKLAGTYVGRPITCVEPGTGSSTP